MSSSYERTLTSSAYETTVASIDHEVNFASAGCGRTPVSSVFGGIPTLAAGYVKPTSSSYWTTPA